MPRRRLPKRIRRSVSRQAQHLLRTGQRFQRFDQIRQRHFWSSHAFLQDATGYIPTGVYKTFITPPGQNGQGYPFQLTELETNWKSANRVPDNQNFEILELGVTLYTLPSEVGVGQDEYDPIVASPKQCNTFMQNTILAIQYLTNEVSLGMCSDFAQASGPMMGSYQPTISDFAPPTGTNRHSFLTNGFAAPALRRRFKVPILLQHGETFSFNLIIPRSFFIADNDTTAFSLFALRIDFWATESFVEKS